jgi:hypothetical protein
MTQTNLFANEAAVRREAVEADAARLFTSTFRDMERREGSTPVGLSVRGMFVSDSGAVTATTSVDGAMKIVAGADAAGAAVELFDQVHGRGGR